MKKFNIGSAGVTVNNTTGAVLGNAVEIVIQAGRGVVIPSDFRMLLKLLDSAGVEMADATEIFWGYKTPADPRRVIPVGEMFPYGPFGDLTTQQQRDADNAASVMTHLGAIPQVFPLIEGETLVLQVYHATGTVDKTLTEFEIPYAEGDPNELANDLAQRKAQYGV